jgi:uncharacterized phage protein (TIGR01671 family)
MREILFHGKRIDNGEWVEGWYIHTKRHHCIITGCIDDGYVVYGHYANDVAMYVVDPETVGQFTGLTDKNGKKIFEGDICQIKNHRLISEVPFVIEWEDFVYNGWVWEDLDENKSEDCFTRAVAKICEVIGNIHDNPELLEINYE